MRVSASHKLEINTCLFLHFIIIFIITQNITKSSPTFSKPYGVSFPLSRTVPKTLFLVKFVATSPARVANMTVAIAPAMAKPNHNVFQVRKKILFSLEKNGKKQYKLKIVFAIPKYFKKIENNSKKTKKKHKRKKKQPEGFCNWWILPHLSQERKKKTTRTENKNKQKTEKTKPNRK